MAAFSLPRNRDSISAVGSFAIWSCRASALIFFSFSPGSFISIVWEFIVKPRNSNSLVGVNWDLLELITNPRFSRRKTSPSVWSLRIVSDSAISKMSSMYMISLTPSSLSWATTGLMVLVKTHGALDRPNGRQLNWYVLPSHSNLRNFRSSVAIGTMKYASFMSTFIIQSFGFSRSFSMWMPSILKCSVFTKAFSRLRFMIQKELGVEPRTALALSSFRDCLLFQHVLNLLLKARLFCLGEVQLSGRLALVQGLAKV